MLNSDDRINFIFFEISALVLSRLSAQGRARAARVTSREREMERLYEFSPRLLALDRRRSPRPEILLLNRQILVVQAVLRIPIQDGATRSKF